MGPPPAPARDDVRGGLSDYLGNKLKYSRMDNRSFLIDALRRTRILKPPKHAISTFGTTTLRYVLLSLVPDQPDYCRLREGEVTAQRPQILTPEYWKNRFQGFGEESEAYREELEKTYGEALKGLEYTFRNDLKNTSLEHATLPEMADRTQKSMEKEDAPRTALLEGPDAQWSLSVMKFIVDTSLRSFSGNVRELEERGLFNPEKRLETRERFEIEKLFQEAQVQRARIPALAERLRQAGRFIEYEDRFFALVQS